MWFQEKLLKPVQDETKEGNQEQGENNDMGPRVADWRFGPAHFWYDMFDVPETGEGFNYGFRLSEKVTFSIMKHLLSNSLSFYVSLFMYVLSFISE